MTSLITLVKVLASCKDMKRSPLNPKEGISDGQFQVLGGIFYQGVTLVVGFLGGSVVKNLPANAGDSGSIPGSGRSLGEGNCNPLQYSCLGNPREKRSLVGYSPWGCRVGHNLETEQQQQQSFYNIFM